MPTVGVGLSLRIHGARNAQGRVTQFRVTTADKINKILVKEAPNAEQRMREAAQAHFNSGEGTGRTANSLALEVRPGKTGASIRFRIGVFRQTRFLTSLLPDSQFQPDPYPITKSGPKLRFFWKAGPAGPGIYYADEVIHPGFGRDILAEQGEIELENLGRLVEMEVRTAVAEVVSNEGQISTFGDPF